MPKPVSGLGDSFGRGFRVGLAGGTVFAVAEIALNRYYQHLLNQNATWLVDQAAQDPQLAQRYLQQYDQNERMVNFDRIVRDVKGLFKPGDYSDPNHQIQTDYFHPEIRDVIARNYANSSGIPGAGPAGNPAVTGSLNGPVQADGTYYDGSVDSSGIPGAGPAGNPAVTGSLNGPVQTDGSYYNGSIDDGSSGADSPNPDNSADANPDHDSDSGGTLDSSGISGAGPAGNPAVTASLNGPEPTDGAGDTAPQPDTGPPGNPAVTAA